MHVHGKHSCHIYYRWFIIKNVPVQYIQQPNVSSLQALETALSTTINATILELDTPTQMMELCNTLAQSLQAHASLEECLSASRVFTNLAAMNTATQSDNDSYYHTRQPEGWCHVLIASQVLHVVAESLKAFAVQVDASYTMTHDAPLLQVCQHMLWAVGNVARGLSKSGKRCSPESRSGSITMHCTKTWNGTQAYLYLLQCGMGLVDFDTRSHHVGVRILWRLVVADSGTVGVCTVESRTTSIGYREEYLVANSGQRSLLDLGIFNGTRRSSGGLSNSTFE